MYRNLHARVECIVPVLDRSLKERLWEILQLHLNDQRQSWDMNSQGDYQQRSASELGVQQLLMNLAKQKSTENEDSVEQ